MTVGEPLRITTEYQKLGEMRFQWHSALRLFSRVIVVLTLASVALFVFLWRPTHSDRTRFALCAGCGDNLARLHDPPFPPLSTLVHEYASWVLSEPIVVLLGALAVLCGLRALVLYRPCNGCRLPHHPDT